MGISLKEIIHDIGGGASAGSAIKAAQSGGPSGGCIPSDQMDTPVDYENLKKLGSMMGSGGLVVTDSGTCMVNFAKFFLSFTQHESCGKCIRAARAPSACWKSSSASPTARASRAT